MWWPGLFGLFEWWGGLKPLIRFGVAFAFLALSTVLWLTGPWGISTTLLMAKSLAIGIVLLLFSFPSDAEKRGYHDF